MNVGNVITSQALNALGHATDIDTRTPALLVRSRLMLPLSFLLETTLTLSSPCWPCEQKYHYSTHPKNYSDEFHQATHSAPHP